MNKYLAITLAAAVIVMTQIASGNESAPRAAQADPRVVLNLGDRVTVTYARSKNYRCAAGTLVVQEWGSRVRLSCSEDQVALTDKARPSITTSAAD